MVVKLDVTNKQKGLSLVISALTPVCECVYKCVQMCVHALPAALWPVSSLRHLSRRATASAVDLSWGTGTLSLNAVHCPRSFTVCLSFLPSLPCCLVPFILLFTQFSSFNIHPRFTILCLLSQAPVSPVFSSIFLSPWQFVTFPPWGSHQFRWALYVTGQLCLFKPLAVLLHPSCHHSPSVYLCCPFLCLCVLHLTGNFCINLQTANTVSTWVKNWRGGNMQHCW